jgi:hypothetical protein
MVTGEAIGGVALHDKKGTDLIQYLTYWRLPTGGYESDMRRTVRI